MHSLSPLLLMLTFLFFVSPLLNAADSAPCAWGDQGDGTYKTPILPGDFSDPDVIRVGDDYYLIVSSFQYSPGMAVLHSRDLVNWNYVSHCIDDTSQIGPDMTWERMNRYNVGVYAGSVRYHAGKFWMFTTTLDEGIFMCTAEKPEGPWSPLHRISDRKGYDDPCPLWDEDGQAYIVMSRPKFRKEGEKWCTTLYKMSPDGKSIDFDSAKMIPNPHNSAHDNGREANKFFKRNGYYYIQHNGNGNGSVTRSKNVWGPYEERAITPDAQKSGCVNIDQGAFIETPSGEWYFLTHEGRGQYYGRQCHLVPITWVDNWPVGANVKGSGAEATKLKKPVAGYPPVAPQSTDYFSATSLGMQWEWNHHPPL